MFQARSASLRPYGWGFTELKIDQQVLSLGKLALESGRGVLPDGTAFDFPGNDDPPPALEIPEDTKEAGVYLSLPLLRPGTTNTRRPSQDEGLARLVVSEFEVNDDVAGAGASKEPLEIAKPDLRLHPETAQLDAYTSLGVAKIRERRSDKKVILDEAFIPPCLDCRASLRLSGFVKEIAGLLHHRGEAVAGRLAAAGQGGVAEVADFLLLQLVNRYEPLFFHLQHLADLHPETFYAIALQLAGELATFTGTTRRPVSLPVYRHHELQETFAPLIKELHRALSMVLETKAVSIPLEEHKYGIRVATIDDRSLLKDAVFVLAVKAQMPVNTLQQRFPSQVKIGPVEKIRDLVNLQLPGIPLRVLAVAPRQIPYHAGFTYFELDRSNENWSLLETSGGCAIHIAGTFPDIELEMWAIKG